MTGQEKSDAATAVCPCCGGSAFTWGALVNSNGGKPKFRPGGPWFTVTSTDEEVRVRKCAGCGNLQLFCIP
jgi:hypothetical protein